MQSLPPLSTEINRMIRYLSGAGAGLSLLSISTSSLPASAIQSLIMEAAHPNDILGTLIDGSVGALSVRPHGDLGADDLEQEFLDRLAPIMSDFSERRIGGRVTLWLRAVHRPAAEIAHAPDLIGCLFDAPSTPLTVSSEYVAAMASGRTPLYARATAMPSAFIEPAERQAPLIRMALSGQWPISLD